MHFRNILKESDIKAIEDILISSGFFYDFEVPVALETVRDNFEKGEEASGYIFIIAEEDGIPVAFACYGKSPCTVESFDLYWIAVHENQKAKGIGKQLMGLIEADIVKRKGKNIWIDTSSRALYEPTRQFYLKQGCEIVAELPDFYAMGDSKVVFLKKV